MISTMENEIPKLSCLPVLGHLPDFKDRRLELLQRAANQGGEICRTHLAGMKIVPVSSAGLAHVVLVQHPEIFHKGPVTLDLFPSVLGQGLMTSAGDKHRRDRKLLTPVFSPRRFADYVPLMVDEVDKEALPEGQTVDLGASM